MAFSVQRFGLVASLSILLLGLNVAYANDENLLGLPENAVENQGSLVVCGGGDLPKEIQDEFVRLAGGKDARLVIIPTAYPFSNLAHAKRVYSDWYDEEVQSVDFLDAPSRKEADDDEFVSPLKHATGVWLSGGMQGRLADIYAGTQTEKLIKRVLKRGGVVGGTSAGASIMSRVMIRYGSSSWAKMDRGLGLVENAIIDQHFLVRGREKRLFKALEENPALIGLGVDEGTAVVIQGNRLRVIGESEVIICMGEKPSREAWGRRLLAGKEFELHARERDDEGELAALSLVGVSKK